MRYQSSCQLATKHTACCPARTCSQRFCIAEVSSRTSRRRATQIYSFTLQGQLTFCCTIAGCRLSLPGQRMLLPSTGSGGSPLLTRPRSNRTIWARCAISVGVAKPSTSCMRSMTARRRLIKQFSASAVSKARWCCLH